MSSSTIRRRIAVCSTIALVSALGASQISAQASSGGQWGAEGRIGSGNAVYLSRWFSPEWSFLIGGNISTNSSKTEGTAIENKITNGNVAALLRKNWGTGSVQPFLAAGPTLQITSNESTLSNGTSTNTSKNTNNGFGARGEIGALIPVSSSVYLGLSSGVSYQRTSTETTANSGAKTKSNTNAINAGNLQFIIGLKF